MLLLVFLCVCVCACLFVLCDLMWYYVWFMILVKKQLFGLWENVGKEKNLVGVDSFFL